jgi:predicted TIM-barrel fold metal-dependent hydrolase
MDIRSFEIIFAIGGPFFGWPFETTLALGRLVYSGVMEKYPNLKIVAHDCGTMVPFFSARIQVVEAAGRGRDHETHQAPGPIF